MKKVISALLALLPIISVGAQESQTVYNFLRLPVSAHAAAIGGDNITIIEDDEALIFHNPALLSSVSDKTINLNYMTYMSGAKTASAAFNKIIKERTSVALSAQYIDYGKMKETDANNVIIGDFTAKDVSIAGYFSYLLSERVVGGIAAKFISSSIGQYNATALGVDLGLNYYDPEHEWSLSLVAKNLGGQLSHYNEESEKMPIDVQAGVSKRLGTTPFRVSLTMVDLNHWNYKFMHHVVAGMDVNLGSSIWLGLGYNFRRASEMNITDSDDEESSHGAGFSIGGGLNLQRFKVNIAYGKYHVSSSSLLFNVAYSL